MARSSSPAPSQSLVVVVVVVDVVDCRFVLPPSERPAANTAPQLSSRSSGRPSEIIPGTGSGTIVVFKSPDGSNVRPDSKLGSSSNLSDPDGLRCGWSVGSGRRAVWLDGGEAENDRVIGLIGPPARYDKDEDDEVSLPRRRWDGWVGDALEDVSENVVDEEGVGSDPSRPGVALGGGGASLNADGG